MAFPWVWTDYFVFAFVCWFAIWAVTVGLDALRARRILNSEMEFSVLDRLHPKHIAAYLDGGIMYTTVWNQPKWLDYDGQPVSKRESRALTEKLSRSDLEPWFPGYCWWREYD